MELLKRFNDPARTDRYNNKKHHWPQGSITVFAIACCLYTCVRIGYAIEQIFGVNPGAELSAIAIVLAFFQRFSTDAQLDSKIYRTGVRISGIAVGMLMYGTPMIVLSDLIYLALHHFVTAPHFRAWMILIGILFGLCVVINGTIHATHPVVVHYEVTAGNGALPQSAKPYRIVQLSDLHIGAIVGERLIRRIVAETEALHPDLIVFTGDQFNHSYVDECRDEHEVAAILNRLHAKDGKWAVLGNHDPEPDDAALAEFYEEAGISPLDNGCVVLDGFNLVGRTGVVADGDRRVPLQKLLTLADSAKPTVVLDHDPMGIAQAADCGAELVLAGHSHQGQFFPYNFFVGRAFPKGYFHGLARTKNTTSIVSAGAGVFQVPLRVGTDSEIVCVDVKL
ncbi:MAG: metallophosphoesterase [Firmicutes bacterium]|nr:metallophosphoesterase [Bacillota bacterium]